MSNPMSENENKFAELVGGYQLQEPSRDFRKGLEKELLGITAVGTKPRSVPRNVLKIAAILLIALVPIWFIHKYYNSPSSTGRVIPLEFSEIKKRVMPLSLTELIAACDSYLGGKIIKGSHGFILSLDLEGSSQENKSVQQISDLVINGLKPEPGWVFLFTKGGEVPGHHWLARFAEKNDYDSFKGRLAKYRDGSIVDVLAESLLSGQGPFSAADLLIRDLYFFRGADATSVLRKSLSAGLRAKSVDPARVIPIMKRLATMRDRAAAITILGFYEQSADQSVREAATVALAKYLPDHLRCFASLSPRLTETMVQYSHAIIMRIKEMNDVGD